MSLTIYDGIIIGAVGGFLAGLTIWIVKLVKHAIYEVDTHRGSSTAEPMVNPFPILVL